MAADNIGEALILLTQLNQKLIKQVGNNKTGTPESEFKEPPKDVIIQDFRAPALEKLNSISGKRIANTGDTLEAAGEKGKGLFSTILTVLGIGAGIAGLTVAFGAADKALGFLGDGSSLSAFLGNLGKGLGDFTDGGGLIALGAMVGAAGVFQIMDNIPGVKVGGIDLAMGIVGIGLGLAGFVTSLALSDKLIDMLGASNAGESISTFLTNLGEGFSNFEGPYLKALAGLLIGGSLFGIVPGLGTQKAFGASLGMTAVGLGIGSFIAGIATGDKVVNLLNDSNPGGNISKLLTNLSVGLKSFTGPHLVGLASLLGVGGLFGLAGPAGLKIAGFSALGMGVIGLGIGSFFAGFSSFEGVMNFLSGNNPGGSINSLLVNLGVGMDSLFTSIGGVTMGDIGILTTASIAVAGAITTLGGSDVVDALLGNFSKVITFFTGGREDPFLFIKDLANDSERIDKGATALDKIVDAFMALKYFDGFDFKIKFNIKEFADDLLSSVPTIDSALFGGTDAYGKSFVGLAGIKGGVEEAIVNINRLKLLFSEEAKVITGPDGVGYMPLSDNIRPVDPENDVVNLTREMRDNINNLVKNQNISNKILQSIDSNNISGNKDIVTAIGSIEFTPINRGVPNMIPSNTRRETLVRDIQANAADQFGTAIA